MTAVNEILPKKMISTDEQQEIRYAAETIYRNINQPQYTQNRYDNSRSHAHTDLLNFITEDYLGGYMQDGRMSVVRRFFCLFVSFDIFFISLLWLISIMLHGDTILNALKDQIINYSIQSSLFDIVLAAFIRFVLLMLFYGIIAINHWSVVALTTTTTCAFLIGKVFFYNWLISAQPLIQVLLIIVSCLLAWGEAWFLDCRVIPQEKIAQRFYRIISSQEEQDERSPLLGPYLRVNNNVAASSIGNFYSPIESAHNSDDEDDQFEEYKTAGIENIKKSLELLESTDWKIENINKKTGDQIQAVHRKGIGKIYRMTARVQFPAKELMRKLFFGIEILPNWNPTVLESKILKKIDKYTDITYQVSAPVAGGIIASRDFVNLRCLKVLRNGCLFNDTESDADDVDGETNNCQADQIPKKQNQSQPRKSRSAFKMNNEKSELHDKHSLISLSRSMGAKILSEELVNGASSDFGSNDLDRDVFVDAKETQSVTTTTNKSNVIPEKLSNGSCDNQIQYVAAGVSIKYDPMPETKHTRGENLVSCFVMRQDMDQANDCILEWLFCLDLKGYFLRSILDRAFTGVMHDFMFHLRKYCNELSKTNTSELTIQI